MSGPSPTGARHKLTVTTVGSGTPVTMNYTLDMRNSLNYQLSATYPGGPSAPEPASILRFIQGIDLTPTFTGTISDLPDYYVSTLQVRLSGSGVTQPSVTIQSTGVTEGAQFTFKYDAANLPVGKTSVELLFPGPKGGRSRPADGPDARHDRPARLDGRTPRARSTTRAPPVT